MGASHWLRLASGTLRSFGPARVAQSAVERSRNLGGLGTMDLTGIWTANDGGIYTVRQIGDLVWWVGLSDPFEFHRGSAAQAGTLLLQVADPSSFTGPVRPKLLQEPFEMEPVPGGGAGRRPQ